MMKNLLTATQIKNVKPEKKNFLMSDGNGLYLIVRSSGTKNFSFKYSRPVSGERKTISLGEYPVVSLAEARESALPLKNMVTKGLDPIQEREKELRAGTIEKTATLEKVAADWWQIKQTRITKDYADDIWRSLENHIFPSMGKTFIGDITAPDAIRVIRSLLQTGALETVKRICQRLNEIMVFAVNTGLIEHNKLAGIKSAFPLPSVTSYPTITRQKLPEFLRRLKFANIYSLTRCLIEFQLHTITRPTEAASAEWKEIDFEKKIWTIPAAKMKMKRDHLIPLTSQVIDILRYLKRFDVDSPYIFPAIRNKNTHLNSETANMAIKRMGYKGKLVAHGLRSLASTILNEQEFNRDWIETALAHGDANQIRAVYNRAMYLDQRRNMMQWWSDLISGLVLSTVIQHKVGRLYFYTDSTITRRLTGTCTNR